MSLSLYMSRALSLALSHTHTQTLTYTHTHTHTHTHTLVPAMSPMSWRMVSPRIGAACRCCLGVGFSVWCPSQPKTQNTKHRASGSCVPHLANEPPSLGGGVGVGGLCCLGVRVQGPLFGDSSSTLNSKPETSDAGQVQGFPVISAMKVRLLFGQFLMSEVRGATAAQRSIRACHQTRNSFQSRRVIRRETAGACRICCLAFQV